MKQLKNEEEGVKKSIYTEKKKYLEKTLPKEGQYIYFPEDYNFFDHKSKILCGGLVRVIERNTNPNELYNLRIAIFGNESCDKTMSNEHFTPICWEDVRDRQEELKSKYKGKKARFDIEHYKKRSKEIEVYDNLKEWTEPW